MNHKLLSVFFSIVLISSISTAQTKQLFVGLSGGLTYSDILKKNEFPGHYDYKPGFSAGLNLERLFFSGLSIETGLGYYQNGYNLNDRILMNAPQYLYTKSYFGFKYLITQSYLNNSWLIGYHIRKKFDFSVHTGLYWAYLLKAMNKSISYSYVDREEWTHGDPDLPAGYYEINETREMNKEAYTKLDFGFVGKISLAYNLDNRNQIICFLKFSRGLIDIKKMEMITNPENYNNSFNFGFGYNIQL
jgi:hypothetical protein